MRCPPPLHAQALAWDLLQQYDCTEQATPQPPPPSAGGSAAANAGAHPQPPAASQDNSNGTLLLPQLGRIQAEAGVPLRVLQLSRPAGPAAPEVRHPYPAPCHGAAHQALGALQGPAPALHRTRFEEQRQLHMPQKHKATASDSTLRVEMNNLEEQADNAKAREPEELA